MGRYLVHRQDANQQAIDEALQAVGALVAPDNSVDRKVAFRGRVFLLECKTPKGPISSRKQRDFLSLWRDYVTVVRSPEEALEAIGALLRTKASR